MGHVSNAHPMVAIHVQLPIFTTLECVSHAHSLVSTVEMVVEYAHHAFLASDSTLNRDVLLCRVIHLA